MKNLLTFARKNSHFVWLIGASMYYLLGDSDMVSLMLIFYIMEDSFDKVEQKINKY
jgi:hypothetical protein